MAPSEGFASIADGTKPNAGRIYDFVLGGEHNFEVDRLAAQQALQLAPFFPQLARTIRWFLGEAVRRLTTEGFTQFIDFASGLPTVDHIHQVSPSGTKVIYSDIDPVTVAYGKEILKDNPNARFVHCDARRPEDLLRGPDIAQLFDENRKIALGFNGIAWFVSDDEIAYSMKVLYDWAKKGTALYISNSSLDSETITPDLQKSLDLYQKMGQPSYMRTLDTLKKIIHPWKVREPGFLDLEEWVGVNAGIAEKTQKVMGLTYSGAILEK
jgi:hypothetical protein